MKDYILVLGIRDSIDLIFSELFIDDLKSATKRFVVKCIELNKNISKEDIDDSLVEGYYSWGNCVIMYIDPYIIHKKKVGKK